MYVCKKNLSPLIMLKKIRVALAVVFWLGVTLLLADASGLLHGWLGWMARIQFLPALLALNLGVVAALMLLTLILGRVYCSVICPLGVLQDGISHLGTLKRKHPYAYKKELKWLRYGVWVLFVIALAAGVQVFVALLAPYSAYGRLVQNFLQPVILWGGNLVESLAERAGTYALYPQEVWLRSLPTFIIALVTLVVLVVLAWKGGRTYCNSICPVGTTLGFLSRFAMFRPVIDESRCIHCRTCEKNCKAHCIEISRDSAHIDYSRCVACFNCLEACPLGGLKYRFAWKKNPEKASGAQPAEGRRAFLAGTAVAVGAAALKSTEALAQAAKKVDGGLAEVLPKQSPERETPLTPPGSRSVKDFYRHCTACQLCVAQCPNHVLRPSADLEHLMQPEMQFNKGFCRPECTRCSELCPSGAIRKIGPEEKTQYHVGVARIQRELCVTESGTSCGKCAQVCPSGAVTMVTDPERDIRIPSVNEALCIGCGACEYYCPARPVSAITVNGRQQHLNPETL